MSLQWSRVDNNWITHPKFLELAADGQWRAMVAAHAGRAYSSGQDLGGAIPALALPYTFARPRDATVLVEAGLWIPKAGGWEVNDWASFQPSTLDAQKRKERAQEAAYQRWHGPKAMRDRNAN